MRAERTNGSLKYTEDEPRDKKAGEIMCRCHATEDSTPGEDHESQEFSNWKLDKDVGNQWLEDQLGEVDDRTEP